MEESLSPPTLLDARVNMWTTGRWMHAAKKGCPFILFNYFIAFNHSCQRISNLFFSSIISCQSAFVISSRKYSFTASMDSRLMRETSRSS